MGAAERLLLGRESDFYRHFGTLFPEILGSQLLLLSIFSLTRFWFESGRMELRKTSTWGSEGVEKTTLRRCRVLVESTFYVLGGFGMIFYEFWCLRNGIEI